MAEIVAGDGTLKRVPLICRIDTLDELDYFKNGGILQYVLRQLAALIAVRVDRVPCDAAHREVSGR